MGDGKVFIQLSGACHLHQESSVDHEKCPVMEDEGLYSPAPGMIRGFGYGTFCWQTALGPWGYTECVAAL